MDNHPLAFFIGLRNALILEAVVGVIVWVVLI